MRRLPWLAAVAAALLGCASEDPDDVFYFLGVVTDGAGAPVPGTGLVLERLRSEQASFSGLCPPTGRVAIHFTVDGLETDPPYEAIRETTANQDAAFYFDLMRFEIQPPNHRLCFAVSAQSAAGARTRSTTLGLAKDHELPDMTLWGAALVEQPGTPPRVALPGLPWEPTEGTSPPSFDETTRRTGYDWVISAGGEMAWDERTDSAPLLLRPELLEDFPSPTATLQAWLSTTVVRQLPLGGLDATDYQTMAQAPPIALSSQGVVPASRGAACRFTGQPLAGCPLTDGSLSLAMLPTGVKLRYDPGLPPPPPDEIILELARPVVPRLLVMRDLHGFEYGSAIISVEGSADGTDWTPLAPELMVEPPSGIEPMPGFNGTGGSFLVDLDSQGEPVQLIRISAGIGTAFVAAREISVFE